MDRPTFRAQYPEYATAPDALVDAYLARATARVDAGVWGALKDEGIGLLTAHLLALAPNGQFARLQSNKGETTYGKEYDRLVIQVATMAYRVI